MNKPLVTVITPTFNRPDYLRQAIQSVQDQTIKDFEHIVVDDCSTEDTASVVKEFPDARIRCVRNQTNLDMSKNYNVGIREARGEYLAFLEDDDLWSRNYLEEQLAVLRGDSSLGAVYCRKVFIDAKNQVIREEKADPPADVFTALLIAPQIVPSALVVKRSVVEALHGFEESAPRGTDYDFSLRVAKAARIVMNPASLLLYRVHPAQLTTGFISNPINNARMNLFIYKRFKDDYRKLPAIGADFVRNIGTNYCLGGEMATGRKYFFEALRLYPWRVKTYRSVLLSLLPSSLYRRLHKMTQKSIFV